MLTETSVSKALHFVHKDLILKGEQALSDIRATIIAIDDFKLVNPGIVELLVVQYYITMCVRKFIFTGIHHRRVTIL